MPPSPTSPDSGIYVDSTNQASEDLVSNFVWSSQAVGYLSDGTMLLCMSGNGAYTDSLYFSTLRITVLRGHDVLRSLSLPMRTSSTHST